jgi:DegV family protein with EDD domain
MHQLRIVTDSAADIDPGLARDLGITVVPLSVHFGARTYIEGVTITAPQFYRLLAESPDLPRTSQPSVGQFEEAYRSLQQEGVQIISIHLSSRLSGTLGAAQTAARSAGVEGIRFVDSLGATILEGELVVAAARLARGGASATEIVAAIERRRRSMYGMIMLDSLAYLQRGGRIGRAQSLVGTLFNIKPIVEVCDGEIAPVQRVRTTARALQALADDARSRMPLVELAILHAAAPQVVEALKPLLQPFAPQADIPVQLIGPVIGAHVGPGAIGVYTLSAALPHHTRSGRPAGGAVPRRTRNMRGNLNSADHHHSGQRYQPWGTDDRLCVRGLHLHRSP